MSWAGYEANGRAYGAALGVTSALTATYQRTVPHRTRQHMHGGSGVSIMLPKRIAILVAACMIIMSPFFLDSNTLQVLYSFAPVDR